MKPELSASKIDNAIFDELLKAYPSHVPSKLEQLEEQRMTTIPKALAERLDDDKKEAYLTKDEVVTLVEWKLHHGTFRPTLRSLVASNDEETIKSTTQSAFSLLPAPTPPYNPKWITVGIGTKTIDPATGPVPIDKDHSKDDDKTVLQALAQLSKLRGIGPATASLFLSTYDSERYPFFSDELFRWLCRDGDWNAKISYKPKEYEELLVTVREFRARNLSWDRTSARDMECVAWTLCKLGDSAIESEPVKKGKHTIEGVNEQLKATKGKRQRIARDTKARAEIDEAERNPKKPRGVVRSVRLRNKT